MTHLNRIIFSTNFMILLVSVFLLNGTVARAEEAQKHEPGKRPYELDWAGRVTDEVPPLVDFEREQDFKWIVETTESEASFTQSDEQRIWGNFTGKLTYHATTEKPKKVPRVAIRPEKPIPITGNPSVPEDFAAISCWIYGNNWAWVPDPSTPQVSILAIFLVGEEQRRIEVRLRSVNWREWFLVFVHLTPGQQEQLRKPGTCFDGFVVDGGRNVEERTLFFDNFALRRDALDTPFPYVKRPRRGVVIPEQNQGTNTGEGQLPFPTRAETLLPECKETVKNSVKEGKNGSIIFTCETKSARFEFQYAPTSGSGPWSSLQGIWSAKDEKTGEIQKNRAPNCFQPLLGGGVTELVRPDGTVVPVTRHEHVETKLQENGTCVTRWNAIAEDLTVPVTYTLKMVGKTLIVETRSVGGTVANVSYGNLVINSRSESDAKLITLPYYTYAYSGSNRPACVLFRDSGVVMPFSQPAPALFLMGHTDWYLGNGSEIYSRPRRESNQITYNGGVRYNPLTDGRRNDCYERFFVTVSDDFQEVLPTIPNPKSPWISVMGSGFWHARGASNRESDKKFWRNVWRHGMRDVIVLDHEVGWRDGGESFTFRTKPAPGKGGDEGQRDFSDFMNRELGFYYGPYNNFTDFAPVNEYWSTDMVSRHSDMQFKNAWARCYAPKPVRAVEYCEKLTPIIQEKFNFRCGYCDVHTAVTPWERVDYDARVPGAGTYASTFYAFGEIMLLQKKGWNGPVYSEGPMHHLYAGMNDGSYAQDKGYQIPFRPWIVDYDLLKIHPISCNFGMGNVDMFYPDTQALRKATGTEKEALLDRFFAATVAFGHPGFLTINDGIRNTWRGYFNLIELQKRYTVAQAEWIRYVDENGKLLNTSDAMASDAYLRSQVVVKYEDGTVICANGSVSETLRATVENREITLPPAGYTGWTADGKIYSFSGLCNGARCDYAYSPKHIYLDSRAKFQKFPFASGTGAGVCRKMDENRWEIILLDNAEIGFKIPDFSRIKSVLGHEESQTFQKIRSTAVALARDGSEMGKTDVTLSRGYAYVKPVDGAFSYVIETCADTEIQNGTETASDALHCDTFRVLAGDTVTIFGKNGDGNTPISFTIPENTPDGERVWFTSAAGRLDFLVTPLCQCEIVEENADSVTFQILKAWKSGENTEKNAENDAEKNAISVSFSGKTYPVSDDGRCALPIAEKSVDYPKFYSFEIRTEGRTQKVLMKSRVTMEEIQKPFAPENAMKKMQSRGKPVIPLNTETGARLDFSASYTCGGVKRTGFFSHPPYIKTLGSVILEYVLDLSADENLALSAFVGKADGCVVGDGIWFRIAVSELKNDTDSETEAGSETVLAEVCVKDNEWLPIRGDFTPWRGKKIRLRLITDCGPKNDTQGDWGVWGDIQLQTAEKMPIRKSEVMSGKLFQIPDAEKSETSGKLETSGISAEKLRDAQRVWLCYRGKGLAGGGDRPTTGILNGISFGHLYEAAGNENAGIFSEEVRVPLPTDILKTLLAVNTLELQNPEEDCFSIRDFRILVEMKDGTQISSPVVPTVITQPESWAHAEGFCVGKDETICVPISF